MLYRKSTLAVLLALIFFSFFGTLTASAWIFPKNYDWRYRVISNLLSPRDNPTHYWMAAGGLALTGLLMLPFAGYLQRHLGVIAPRAANISAGAFAPASSFRSTPMMSWEFADSMSFLAAPPQVFWQWECYAAVGAPGKAADETCLQRNCFGSGH